MCNLKIQGMDRAGEIDFRTDVEKEWPKEKVMDEGLSRELPDLGSAAVRGEAVAEELREIDAVLAENDRLRDALADKISGETLLTELNMNQGGLNMQFQGGACQMLAEQFAQQFREMGGNNYIEMGFTARSDGMPLLVTIQRVSGKTPATLKAEAEAKLATVKNFHRSLCARFGYSHDDQDWLRDLVSLEEFIAAKVSPRPADAPSEPSRADMEAIDRAMQHMGDTLNECDMCDEHDEEVTAAGFAAIARLLKSHAADAPSEPSEMESVYLAWNDQINAWVDVGLAEYLESDMKDRRLAYEPKGGAA